MAHYSKKLICADYIIGAISAFANGKYFLVGFNIEGKEIC
jgi:hypothetical protein